LTSGTVEFARETIPGFSRTSKSLFVLPPKDKDGKARLNRPENEIVAAGEKMFLAAKSYRDQQLGMLDRWRTYRAWYLNSGTMDGQASGTPVNLIYEKIEKLTADLAQGKPEFLFEPNTISDISMVDLLNAALPWVWDTHFMNSMYSGTIKSTTLYGTWYWKVINDPQYGKTGAVQRAVMVPVWNGFPCPYATDFDNAPWFIEIKVRTVGEIYNDYGVKVNPEVGINQIFPGVEEDLKQYAQSSQATVEGASGTYNVPHGGTVDGVTPTAFANAGIHEGIPDTAFLSDKDRAGMVIQKELHIRDSKLVSEFWTDDKDGIEAPEIKSSMTLKYPRGRVISWANGKLLYDVENPYRDGRFPYVKFVDIPIPDFWYGMGEVEQLIPLQLLHDDTHEIVKSVHLRCAVGWTVVDTGTGLTEDDISGEVGEILFVNPGTADRVKIMTGLSPPAELYSYLQTLERASDLITGSFDVTRGIKPTGVTAGRALQTLQAAASIRIRERLTGIEDALKRFARLMASRIQQYWEPQMSLRVAGPRALSQLEDKPFAFKDFFISAADREATYNVKVSASANLAETKNQEFLKLIQILQAGIPVPPETLIESADLINEKEVLLAMAQAQVQQAQQLPPNELEAQ
jgi:hypothetical protein